MPSARTEGGHDAIHPELGTHRGFPPAARRGGGARAGDRARLRHPVLARSSLAEASIPAGSTGGRTARIRYAENPPKKYEDIVNVDFYAEAALPDLWLALRDVVAVLGRARACGSSGSTTRTPSRFPFWEWLIADIRGRASRTSIFLAEAFTRPKVMYRLAKIGFSQSYTYFTWRNTQGGADQISDRADARRRRRTSSGRISSSTRRTSTRTSCRRAGRAGLPDPRRAGATLSGLWGVYNGFELCEARRCPGKRGISRLREVRAARLGLGPARQHRRRDHRAQPHPPRESGAAVAISALTFLQRLQRQHPVLREGDAGPRQRRAGRGQSRSAPRRRRPISRCRCGNGACPTTAALVAEDLMRGARVHLARQDTSTSASTLPTALSRSGASRPAQEA